MKKFISHALAPIKYGILTIMLLAVWFGTILGWVFFPCMLIGVGLNWMASWFFGWLLWGICMATMISWRDRI